jgi:hypothetical protein
MSPQSSRIFTGSRAHGLTGTSPVTMPNATVRKAPMPTQTAYAVPVGSLRVA